MFWQQQQHAKLYSNLRQAKKEGTLDSSGLPLGGTLISASAVPHGRPVIRFIYILIIAPSTAQGHLIRASRWLNTSQIRVTSSGLLLWLNTPQVIVTSSGLLFWLNTPQVMVTSSGLLLWLNTSQVMVPSSGLLLWLNTTQVWPPTHFSHGNTIDLTCVGGLTNTIDFDGNTIDLLSLKTLSVSGTLISSSSLMTCWCIAYTTVRSLAEGHPRKVSLVETSHTFIRQHNATI